MKKNSACRYSNDLETLNLRSLTLTPRQLCDLELIMNGGFYPLSGFLSEEDYTQVLENMRLKDGSLWPIPINLDVDKDFAQQSTPGEQIALQDLEGKTLALLEIKDCWKVNKAYESLAVFGTTDLAHPGVKTLFSKTQDFYLGGKITPLELPKHYDFPELRQTPDQLKEHFNALGWSRILAFQTRNPMHRAHIHLTEYCAEKADAKLLIHPAVGLTKPGDVDHFTRVRCYQAALKHYPQNTAALSLLPLAMRMAGPREALWHAIIRQNYGCTHFVVGRDHAGPGKNSQGENFYSAYAAQELLFEQQQDLEIEIITSEEIAYDKKRKKYSLITQETHEEDLARLSGTELRNALRSGQSIPDWFSYPEIIQELRKAYPLKKDQGFTLFFTGLSGSGKSTLANILAQHFLSKDERKVTLLDGDVFRKIFSAGLGFSREDRLENIQRIAYMASEITRHGGIAIAAQIAPYQEARDLAKEFFSDAQGFIQIYLSTPLETCEARDTKGLYKKARAGIIQGFTGISDPYEAPNDADLVIDTSQASPEEQVQIILNHLEERGYLASGKNVSQL